jgi:hypothetical protein
MIKKIGCGGKKSLGEWKDYVWSTMEQSIDSFPTGATNIKLNNKSRGSGTHSGGYKEFYLLGYHSV